MTICQSAFFGLSLMMLFMSCGISRAADPVDNSVPYFGIQIVDSKTGRGVPLVQLRTVNDIDLYSDSAGWVAFHEPGLMNRDVFFHVSSHGYEFPADGFGIRGVRLKTVPGKTARIEIQRKNLAERVYRITGQGIYRDSMLLGEKLPTAKPTLNGDVLGQDTVQAAVYRRKLYWFWGDTNRPSYPLGQYRTSGATSLLPQNGGLTPDIGIDLNYFVNESGFSRKMAPFEGDGAIWLHGLFVLKADGSEKMIAHYSRVRTLGEMLEHGLAIFDDETETFEKLVQFDDNALLYPRGQSLSYEHGVESYIYFCSPFPSVRVRANLSAIQDPAQYESFTCLKQGTRFELKPPDGKHDEETTRPDLTTPQIDTDNQGKVIWAWKQNTQSIDAPRQQRLVQRKYLKQDDARAALFDDERQKLIYLHTGSVHWNPYRRRWVMLAEQYGGETSFLGEMWYAEAESLEGPWQNARHVVSHNKYTFYNPTHHRFFDQQDGRVIYFEGTYADTFSAAPVPTPRYNYNQIMYRLDLGNTRLNLPAIGQ